MLSPVFNPNALGLTAGRVVYYDGSGLASALAVTYAASGDLVTVASGANADIPLSVQGNGTGGTQTGDLFRWRDNIGRIGRINARGAIICPGAAAVVSDREMDLSVLGPAAFGSVLVWSTPLTDATFSQTDPTLNIGFGVSDLPARQVVFRTQERWLASIGSVEALNDPTFILWSHAGTVTNRQIVSLEGVFHGSVADATRKGRGLLQVWDWAGKREAIRAESDGTQAMIGFLGAPAVVRPAVTGSRADPEQALASLLTALASLGLITDSTTA